MSQFNPNVFHAAAWLIWRKVLWVKKEAPETRSRKDAEKRISLIHNESRSAMWKWMEGKEKLPTFAWTWYEQACDVVSDYEKQCSELAMPCDDSVLVSLVNHYEALSDGVYEEIYYRVYGEFVPEYVEDNDESDITLQTQRLTCLNLMFDHQTRQFMAHADEMVAEGAADGNVLSADTNISTIIDEQIKSNERLLKELIKSCEDVSRPRPALRQSKSRKNMMNVQKEATKNVEKEVQEKTKRWGRAMSILTKKRHNRKRSNKEPTTAGVAATIQEDRPAEGASNVSHSGPGVAPKTPNEAGSRPAPPRKRQVSTNSSEVTDRFRRNNKTQSGNIVMQFMVDEFVRACWDAFTSQRNPTEGVETFLTKFEFPSTNAMTSATMRTHMVMDRIPERFKEHSNVKDLVRKASERIGDAGARIREIKASERMGNVVEWSDKMTEELIFFIVIADALPMSLDMMKNYVVGYTISHNRIYKNAEGSPDHGGIYKDFHLEIAAMYNDYLQYLFLK